MKKILKEICLTFGAIAMAGFLIPFPRFSTGGDLEEAMKMWMNPLYWPAVAALILFVRIEYWYLEIYNPRRSYLCMRRYATLIVVLVSFVWIPIFVVVGFSVINELSLRIFWFGVGAVLYALFLYAMIGRGVIVYKKGRIIVLKFWIKTYRVNWIDDVNFEYDGDKCTAYITVCGDVHDFQISANAAQKLESRLKHPPSFEYRSFWAQWQSWVRNR